MNALEALCGNCEHRWNVFEHGIDECPACGSKRIIKPRGLTEGMPEGLGQVLRVRIEPVFGETADLRHPGVAIPHPAVDASALKNAFWVLMCAVGVALALSAGLPLATLPFKMLLALLGTATLAKMILAALLAGPIAKELGAHGISLNQAQVVGHVVFEALVIAGLAGLLNIWWPVAAAVVLLSGAVHGALAVVGMVAAAVLRIPCTAVTMTLYAALVGAVAYHGLQWLIVL